METNTNTNSSRLAQAREALALTQTDLARMAGLAQSTVARLEAGESSPSVSTAQRLAQALKTTVSELFPAPQPQCDPFLYLIAEARYSAKQALLARAEVQWRERNGIEERELRWLRKAEKNHTEALAHQLLSIPESARDEELKALCAQVWVQ